MKSVLLIGETCIDEFIYGSVDRISQEAPCPIFLSNGDKKITGGMCANVKNNIDHLSENIEVQVLTNDSPIVKRRLIDTRHGNMVYRVDEQDRSLRVNLLLSKLTKKQWDAVVVSDYNKGFLLDEDLVSIGEVFNCPKFIDTKKIISKSWGKKFDFIKINSEELFANIASHGSIEKVKEACNSIIVTKGEEGSVLYETDCQAFDSYKTNVSHVSGAGDTFLAALVIRTLETGDIKEAIDFANLCASIAVSKENVSFVSRKEANNLRRSNKNITTGSSAF